MSQCALIYNCEDDFASQADILSRPLCCYMANLARAFGCSPLYLAGRPCPECGEDAELIETDFSGGSSLFAALAPADRKSVV